MEGDLGERSNTTGVAPPGGGEGTEVQAELSTGWPRSRKGMVGTGVGHLDTGDCGNQKPHHRLKRLPGPGRGAAGAKVLQDVDLEETALEDATDLNLAFSNKGTISPSAIKGGKSHI